MKKYTSHIATAIGIASATLVAIPAFAAYGVGLQTTAGTNHILAARVDASTTLQTRLEQRQASTTQNRIETMQSREDQMIAQRIQSLQNLQTRLSQMHLLTSTELANLQASINAEIQTLTSLQSQVASGTSTTTLKADAQTIINANRIYLLVIPKAQIAAAADRIDAIVTQFQAFGSKLQARIADANNNGISTAATPKLSDFTAKIADAKTQADAAVAETVNLQPDNGNKTVLASNLAALKDARSKLAAARQDLADARHDAAVIFSIIKNANGASANASTSASVNH